MEGDEDFIPRSARIDFQFHMSKKAEERPEFLALQQEINSHIANLRKFLRQQIIKTTEFEANALTEELKIGYIKAIRLTIEAFFIGDDISINIENVTIHTIVSSLLNNRHDTLLRHTSFSSFEDFCDAYKRLHNFSEFPHTRQGDGSGTTPATTASPFFNRNTNTQLTVRLNSTTTPVSPLELDKIACALESVFITPFDEDLRQFKKNQITLSLKKIINYANQPRTVKCT
jgi:hypothetical protein